MDNYVKKIYDQRVMLRFDRQRRWLIIFTIILFIVDFGNVCLTKISIFGNTFDVERGNEITQWVLPFVVIYFMFTFWQAKKILHAIKWPDELWEAAYSQFSDVQKMDYFLKGYHIGPEKAPNIFSTLSQAAFHNYFKYEEMNLSFPKIRSWFHACIIETKFIEYWLPLIASSVVVVFVLIE